MSDVDGALPSATYSMFQEHVPKLHSRFRRRILFFLFVSNSAAFVACSLSMCVMAPLWSHLWDTSGMVYEHGPKGQA